MEPFGILNLLKPLLDLTPSSTPESAPPPTSGSVEETTPKEENEGMQNRSQSAIMEFMEAHDARAKRRKR